MPTFELVCRIPLGHVDFYEVLAYSGMVPCTLRDRRMSWHSPGTSLVTTPHAGLRLLMPDLGGLAQQLVPGYSDN